MLAFAQTTEAVKLAAEGGRNLMEYGILGTLCVLFMLSTVAALYAAWKSKQSQIDAMKSMMEANKEEALEAKDFSINQTKAYENLAGAVADLGISSDGLGKRIDSLASATSNVDITKYYAQRGS